jgi:hypothetical protein
MKRAVLFNALAALVVLQLGLVTSASAAGEGQATSRIRPVYATGKWLQARRAQLRTHMEQWRSSWQGLANHPRTQRLKHDIAQGRDWLLTWGGTGIQITDRATRTAINQTIDHAATEPEQRSTPGQLLRDTLQKIGTETGGLVQQTRLELQVRRATTDRIAGLRQEYQQQVETVRAEARAALQSTAAEQTPIDPQQ